MRRRVMLFAIVAASAALTACAQATAPHQDECRSGYYTSEGKFVCTDPG